MTQKILTVNLGGVDRQLNFGKFWFQHFYGEASGQDPLNATEISLEPGRMFKFVINLVYAALQTQYKKEKKTQDFKKDDVAEWVGDMENDDVAVLVNNYVIVTGGSNQAEVLKEVKDAIGAGASDEEILKSFVFNKSLKLGE